MFKQGDVAIVVGEKLSDAQQCYKGQEVILTKIYSTDYSSNGYRGTLWEVDHKGTKQFAFEVDLQLINKKMEKFYQVMQDTYLFKKGAVLSNKDNSIQYKATHDIWNVEGNDALNKFMAGEPSITAEVVENSPEWFNRVYSKRSITGIYYVTKEKLRELLASGKIGEDVNEKEEEIKD